MNSPADPTLAVARTAAPKTEVRNLRDLSPTQWKSGLAAWLGWLFDGLDMHLYTLVAAPFVAQLLFRSGAIGEANPADALVKEKSSWIQAAFLIGWALGGGFFGCVGDRLGRSRALSLTILMYACFTGLSFVAQTWWQLLLFRFLAALGIGGEWAVGSAIPRSSAVWNMTCYENGLWVPRSRARAPFATCGVPISDGRGPEAPDRGAVGRLRRQT